MPDIVTYHADLARTGSEAGVTHGGHWRKYNTITLTPPSAVRGAPLYLQGWLFSAGPRSGETHDLVFVATSDNRVLAYAEGQLRAGGTAPIWSRTLGPPSMRPGSNIPPPIGVCSTPVLDPDNGRLFVLALQNIGGGGDGFFIYALDLDTGAVLQSAPLSDAGAPHRPTFDGKVQDQRGALNLVAGQIYATFAAFLAYDSGLYHGWVVGCNANNLSQQHYFPLTRNVFGGGAWGPGGAAAAADGSLYVATGNATSAVAAYWAQFDPGGTHAGHHPGDIGDYFEGVVRLGFTGPLRHRALALLDWYQPTNARALNDADEDLGASSVLVLPTISGRDMVVTTGKDGDVYLLDRLNLGHWGGELWRAHVFSQESKCAPAYFRTAAGAHYVYVVGSGTPGLVAYRVQVVGGGASLVEVWRATGAGIALGDAPGSAVVGVGPGATGSGLVWIADEAAPPVLRAFDALTGMEIFNSNAASGDATGPLPHFPGIACAGESVFIGTSHGFACYGHGRSKIVKELKYEIKEFKESLKFEMDLVVKRENEGPKLKDAEGDPFGQYGGDPGELIRLLAARIDDLEERLAAGRAFIRDDERPAVGDEPLAHADDGE